MPFASGPSPRLIVGGDGGPGFAIWNGASWQAIMSFNEQIQSMRVIGIGGQPTLFVGGRFTERGDAGIRSNHITTWNGTAWNELDDGLSAASIGEVLDIREFSFSTSEDPIICVAGAFDHAGGQPVVGVAGWDGSNWLALNAPVQSTGSTTYFALASVADGFGGTNRLFASYFSNPAESTVVYGLIACQPGDANQDGTIDGDDVQAFVDCIMGAGNCINMDIDGDGLAGSLDAQDDAAAFIACLINS